MQSVRPRSAAFHHASRTTGGTKSAPFTAKSDQVLVATFRAFHAQETTFQSAAAKVSLELVANKLR